jgi:hypothetical protein
MKAKTEAQKKRCLFVAQAVLATAVQLKDEPVYPCTFRWKFQLDLGWDIWRATHERVVQPKR